MVKTMVQLPTTGTTLLGITYRAQGSSTPELCFCCFCGPLREKVLAHQPLAGATKSLQTAPEAQQKDKLEPVSGATEGSAADDPSRVVPLDRGWFIDMTIQSA